ncbi:MAG TPA: S8 family peptidase [Chitinophagaceae bacterium]|nr:S8 family peptidase [Chitinophagaceae bacterium]
MKKTVLFGIVFFCATKMVQAQPGRYLIQLKDKAQNPFSLAKPDQFLSSRSMARRARYGISIDSTDLPATPAYIDSIRSVSSVTVLNISKWLNQVSIQTPDAAALDTIRKFPFVASASFIASRAQRKNDSTEIETFQTQTTSGIQGEMATQAFDYGAASAQVSLHHGDFLHNIGLQGQGMVLTLLDAGFYHYDALHAFDSALASGQVLDTWDFVVREQSVAEDHQHGMYCFSIIAANMPGQFVGTAPKASFYLFRTEDVASEYEIEEHNWVCGVERADSAGSDVISSSLGYNNFDNGVNSHSYSDLDGNKTIAATGADLAAKKGILVVNAAGNEGDKAWKYIMTPADADSILVVGAVDKNGAVASFSSYGPSADGQVKPDVVSVGVNTVIQSTSNTVATGNGTSFACPNMAGLSTCLWQGFPEITPLKIIDVLRHSGSQAQAPDNRMGYGIPDMRKAVQLLLQESATVAVTDCKTLNWTSKDAGSMRYEIERRKSGESSFSNVHNISGRGETFQTQQYQFTDSSLQLTDVAVQYRIRQVLDTSATSGFAFYLDTVTITTADCNGIIDPTNSIQLLPNPVQLNLVLKMNSEAAIANLQLLMVNAIGQTVYTNQTTKPTGSFVLPVQTTGLARGIYYLIIYDAKKRLATKTFVKL